MSPEYWVEIVAPYTYVVDSADGDEAEMKAWAMSEDDLDDYNHPALIESIEEIKEHSLAKPGEVISRNDRGEIVNLIAKARDIQEFPLTAMMYRLTAEGRMPKVTVQVDDETGQVEAARLRVAGVQYFFHQTTDNEAANQSTSSGTKVIRQTATRFRHAARESEAFRQLKRQVRFEQRDDGYSGCIGRISRCLLCYRSGRR